jgi:hypothetical protein
VFVVLIGFVTPDAMRARAAVIKLMEQDGYPRFKLTATYARTTAFLPHAISAAQHDMPDILRQPA